MSIIEKLGYLGSFINALAMIGSVIYLALQVRQANNLARLSAVDSLRDSTNRFRELLLREENLAVWLKGSQPAENLTDAERYRLDELSLYLMDSTQASYLRARRLGDRYSLWRIGYTIRYASTGTRFKTWWERRRERYHPEFASFVNDNLDKPIEPLGSLKGLRS